MVSAEQEWRDRLVSEHNRGFDAGAFHERDRCIAIVEAEPELPGAMPFDLYDHSKETIARASVRATKANIIKKINADE